MKKRFFVSLLLVILIFLLAATVLVACNKDLLEYAVTVTYNNEPVEGVTVKWSAGGKVKGSAKTDANGRASVMLKSGTYSVDLSGYADGLTYTRINNVTPSMRDKWTISLKIALIDYTVKVTDKDGNPAVGVIVNYLADNKIEGSATTAQNGVATCALPEGEYSVRLNLFSLPDFNVMESGKTYSVSTSNSHTNVNLVQGSTITYTVTVRSEGGLRFDGANVLIDDRQGNNVDNDFADEDGIFRTRLEPGDYVADLFSAPDGYTFDPVELTDNNRNVEIVLYSEPIAFENLEDIADVRYLIGDIIHDFRFTTTYFEDDGVTVYFSKSISEMLAEGKKAIIINNWGKDCSFCVNEMPEMQKAYEKYGDEVEIIGLSNYTMIGDSEVDIENFVIEKGYTFPLMRDYNDFGTKIGLNSVFTGWPLTVVVDRYGAIARIESGAILDADSWEFMFDMYVGDDYVQDFIPGSQVSGSIKEEMAKPDIKVDADHYNKIAQTINASFNEGMSVTYSAVRNNDGTLDEYAWPFLLDVVNGVSVNGEKVLYSSNYHRASSYSAVDVSVTAPAGKVFTFDYYCDTEEDDDILSFVWEGKVVKQISGNSGGWQTCHLYTALTDGTHKLTIAYLKSSVGNSGKDTVYLKNVRFSEVSDITSANMLRAAAYGTPERGATQFPHYAGVELGADGYYHVKLDTLENNGYAGTDSYPLLLINMLSATNWFGGNIIDKFVYGKDQTTGVYAVDCTFSVNGVTKDWRDTLGAYMHTAGSSDIKGCLPVDKELHDLIIAFIRRIKETAAQQTGTALQYHDNEWLEACYFYSHYGTGAPVGNPIIGITEKTAIAIELNAVVSADLTRYTNPFPFAIYSFTAPADGLYKVESFIPEKDAEQYQAQVWFYNDSTSAANPLVEDGEERYFRDGENEQNFTVYYYMHKGEKYYIQVAMHQMMGTYDFSVTRVSGDSATRLLPCSANDYTCDLDDKGNMVGDYYLKSIEFGKGSDGYYRVKDKDGKLGDYIYLDVAYVTAISHRHNFAQLIDLKNQDPYSNKSLDYNMFDFRYGVNYIFEDDGKGGLVFNGEYDPKANLTHLGEEYKDYTQYLKDYIANEDNQGPENGLIKVDESIVNILTLFFEIRINQLYNGFGKAALPNEWLRLCWYYKTYDANNIY